MGDRLGPQQKGEAVGAEGAGREHHRLGERTGKIARPAAPQQTARDRPGDRHRGGVVRCAAAVKEAQQRPRGRPRQGQQSPPPAGRLTRQKAGRQAADRQTAVQRRGVGGGGGLWRIAQNAKDHRAEGRHHQGARGHHGGDRP